jgi:hypothetical protein
LTKRKSQVIIEKNGGGGAMLLIKIGQRIINLNNVKFIELMETNGSKEIRFYFTDGSYSYFTLKKDERDIEFETVWEYLNKAWVFINDDAYFAK